MKIHWVSSPFYLWYTHLIYHLIGDSIAIWSLKDDGSFTFVKQVHMGFNNLRGFIIDPSGRFLVAGGNVSGGIKVFERIDGGADLVQVAASTQVPTASSFVWL